MSQNKNKFAKVNQLIINHIQKSWKKQDILLKTVQVKDDETIKLTFDTGAFVFLNFPFKDWLTDDLTQLKSEKIGELSQYLLDNTEQYTLNLYDTIMNHFGGEKGKPSRKLFKHIRKLAIKSGKTVNGNLKKDVQTKTKKESSTCKVNLTHHDNDRLLNILNHYWDGLDIPLESTTINSKKEQLVLNFVSDIHLTIQFNPFDYFTSNNGQHVIHQQKKLSGLIFRRLMKVVVDTYTLDSKEINKNKYVWQHLYHLSELANASAASKKKKQSKLDIQQQDKNMFFEKRELSNYQLPNLKCNRYMGCF